VTNRYYSNAGGRFMTPDPYTASGGPILEVGIATRIHGPIQSTVVIHLVSQIVRPVMMGQMMVIVLLPLKAVPR
jgi:hypothetical protein